MQNESMSYFTLNDKSIQTAFDAAKEYYSAVGVDAEEAIDIAAGIPLSLHCWQADDVTGLEHAEENLTGGGIFATGSHPGRARNGAELRADYEKVLGLLPGTHRLNFHACYAETPPGTDRDELTFDHMKGWLDWAQGQGIHLDFNTTFFAHPKADQGFTLSHLDPEIRDFWIRHGKACRKIAEEIAAEQGGPCVLNHWIPDGSKDSPADRWSPRARLLDSLDQMLDKADGIDPSKCLDALESKLFGIGSEDYVVGSAEFYSSYALSRNILYCLDMGHFHPTETIHGKLSSYLQFHKKLLFHVSRPIRWDSDHVVIFNDDLRNVFLELQRGQAMDKALVAMDFFDASINRITAYVIGARATRKAILYALLDPTHLLQSLEREGNGGQKLAIMDEMKTLPFDAVWNMLCLKEEVPPGLAWIPEVEVYEREVLLQRG